MVRKLVVGVGIGALLVGAQMAMAGSAKADATKLKVGTPAAPDSPWGQVFKTWKKAVEAKTSNAVSFDFFQPSHDIAPSSAALFERVRSSTS